MITSSLQTNEINSAQQIAQTSNFSTTVIHKQITLSIFDGGTAIDGDLVTVFVNSTLVAGGIDAPLPPPAGALKVQATLVPGINTIVVRSLNLGLVPLNTAVIEIDNNDVLQGEPRRINASPIAGGVNIYEFGFPQIGVSQGRYPQSAQHIQEAWAGLPSEFRPSTTKIATARLLEIDRSGKSKRRDDTMEGLEFCPLYHVNPKDGKLMRDERDEYPPALFKENDGNAHLKCIYAWDNGGSGASFGRQINSYKAKPTSNAVKLKNTDVVEMVIAP